MYGDGWAHVGLYTGSRAPFSSRPILSRSRGHKASTCLMRPTIVTSTASTMWHTVWSALYTQRSNLTSSTLISDSSHIFLYACIVLMCLHIKTGQHVLMSVSTLTFWRFKRGQGSFVSFSVYSFILTSDLPTGDVLILQCKIMFCTVMHCKKVLTDKA